MPADAPIDFALRLILRALTELIGEVRALRTSIETHRASVDASTAATKDAAKEGFWPWARTNPAQAVGLAVLVVLALQGQAAQVVPLVLTHFWGSSNVSH